MTALSTAQDAMTRAMRAEDWPAYRSAVSAWNDAYAAILRRIPKWMTF